MPKALVLSSDGHAAPELAAYRPYLSPAVRGDLDDLIAAFSQRVTVNFFDFLDPEVAGPYRKMMYDSGVIEGKWNVEHRLESLSNEGILGEVIFPDGAPFGAGGLGSARTRYPRHLELEGGRAYNRWLVDYISGYEKRFAAQAIISLVDIGEAVKDVYWAAEQGFKGIVMPGMDDDLPMFWADRYEPFWAACAETGLVLNFHGGIGQPTYGGAKLDGVPDCVRMRVSVFEFPWFAHRPLWFMVWSGVLERHPSLRLVFTEQHSDWLVATVAQMDHSWLHGTMERSIRDIVPHPPSYYTDRQVFLGSSILSAGEVFNRNQIGVDRMMFGADFPHPEGTYGSTLGYLRTCVGRSDMTVQEATAFLGGNASRIFGFDPVALDPVVQRHGLELDDIMTPPSEEEAGDLMRRDAFRPVSSLTYAPVALNPIG
ncbi:putative Amidohydrolase 2 [Frankia canadensis]|uniref:Putative Amidohydrolase 2 n=1 Tax=Frankia canadensis TaxID=1836972 RepID=A0A2I2KI45_9ACTN|nr:amidohydrolase family protein [Frankia canadensis]SNQ45336.1 putative Amidohydrolase 2 [Frankia canadensis]SOU52626.1 putative Amidohydrolase 2 [Frankia canadensis]